MNLQSRALFVFCLCALCAHRPVVAQGYDWEATGPYGGFVDRLEQLPNGDFLAETSSRNRQVYRSTDEGASWSLTDLKSAFTALVVGLEGELYGRSFESGKPVYLSRDEGRTWSRFNLTSPGGVQRSSVKAVLIDHQNSLMFARTAADGVLRSDDGGTTWTSANQGLPDYSISHLTIGTDNHLFALGTGMRHIYRSSNNGNFWESIGGVHSTEPPLESLWATPRGTIFSVTTPSYFPPIRVGLYRSTDQGKTWARVSLFRPRSLRTATNGDLFFRDNQFDLYRSVDDGQTWTLVSAELPRPERPRSDPFQTVLSFALGFEGSLLVGTPWGVYRSTDEGASWVRRSEGINTLNVIALAQGGEDTIYAATDLGVYKTPDDGARWEPLWLSGTSVFALTADETLFAGTPFAGARTGVYRSSDKGSTWTQQLQLVTLDRDWTTSLVAGMSNLVVATSTAIYMNNLVGYIHVSRDKGDTWSTSFFAMANTSFVGPDGNLYVGAGRQVWRSTDEGASWSQVADLGMGSIRAFAADAEGHLFIGASSLGGMGEGLYRSTDQGETWTKVNLPSGDRDIVAFATYRNTHTLALSADGYLYLSTDGDRFEVEAIFDWQDPSSSEPRRPTATSLAINAGGRVFIGTKGYGTFRSVQSLATATEPGNDEIPEHVALKQNYPNPFNPVTTISFSLPRSSSAKLEVFDVLGRKVRTLLDEYRAAGEVSVTFAADNLPSGVYTYRLEAGDFVQSKRMILAK